VIYFIIRSTYLGRVNLCSVNTSKVTNLDVVVDRRSNSIVQQRGGKIVTTMAIEFNATILVPLLVGLVVVIGGLYFMRHKAAETTKRSSRSPKASSKSSPRPQSPTVTKKVATGTGSVSTPAGRRSARLARKSLEHND
ncbi:hypothetical protein ACHAWF_004677, partial [Thalassiosira exigua]